MHAYIKTNTTSHGGCFMVHHNLIIMLLPTVHGFGCYPLGPCETWKSTYTNLKIITIIIYIRLFSEAINLCILYCLAKVPGCDQYLYNIDCLISYDTISVLWRPF